METHGYCRALDVYRKIGGGVNKENFASFLPKDLGGNSLTQESVNLEILLENLDFINLE